MKFSNIPFFVKVLLASLVVISTLSLNAFSTKKATFLSTSVVPEAKGEVNVKDDNSIKNIDQIKTSTNIFSGKLKDAFEKGSPFKRK